MARKVDPVTGTFTTTGQSPEITVSQASIKMDFAGTATVVLETKMPSGSWIAVESVTADYDKIYDAGETVSTIRLNCTAHTNDVEYAISGVVPDRYQPAAT